MSLVVTKADIYCMKAELDTDHDKLAELKYMCKFAAHRVLEMLCLCLSHLTTREVKHFLAAVIRIKQRYTTAQYIL